MAETPGDPTGEDPRRAAIRTGLLIWLAVWLVDLQAAYPFATVASSPVLRRAAFAALGVALLAALASALAGVLATARPGPRAAGRAAAGASLAAALLLGLPLAGERFGRDAGWPYELLLAGAVLAVIAAAAATVRLATRALAARPALAGAPLALLALCIFLLAALARFGLEGAPPAILGLAGLGVLLSLRASVPPQGRGLRATAWGVGFVVPCFWIALRIQPFPAAGDADRPVPADAPHVVVVMIDTLRADVAASEHAGGPLMPALTGLGSRGATRFESAYAGASATAPSVKALFTGQLASHWGLDAAADPPPPEAWTLARAFRSSGWDTFGVSANGVVDGPGFTAGFDGYWCASGLRFSTASFLLHDWLDGAHLWRTFERATRWRIFKEEGQALRAHVRRRLAGRGERPLFLYVHLFDPHWPYYDHGLGIRDAELAAVPDPLGFWQLLRRPRGHAENRKLGASRRMEEVRSRYREEVRYTDGVLDGLVDDLRQAGIWDDTLLVVVGDHGEEFFEHLGFSHGHDVYDEQVRVPFLLRWPARDAFAGLPATVSEPVSLLDVLPTLTDALALAPAPEATAGQSLWPLLTGGSRPPGVTSEAFLGPLLRLAYREGDFKVRVQTQRTGGPGAMARFLFYDLAADPGEQTPVPQQSQPDAFVRRAQQTARSIWASARQRSQSPAATLDDDELEQLRRLGYIR